METTKKAKKSKEETQEVKVLSSYDVTKSELEVFVADYKNLVVTDETFKDAKKAREAIREKRYAIQAIQKKNDDARIAWNKSEASKNKTNAEELIAVLLPTEEAIDKAIKAIEEVKEAEKQAKLKAERELLEFRSLQIIGTGAQFTGVTYVLNQQYVDTTELIELSEEKFQAVLLGFQEEANKIKAEKDAEAKRIAEEQAKREAEQKAKEDALKAEQDALAKAKAEQDAREKAFQDEQKRITEEAYNKRLADEKALADKEAQLEAERKQLEAEKQAIIDAKIKQRKTALFSIGMAINGSNFVFHECELWMESVTDSSDEEFEIALERVTNEICEIKTRLAKEEAEANAAAEKAKEEAEAAQKRRAEALKPDKEKLNDFIKSLRQITGPEVSSEEARGIIEMAISQIQDTAKFIGISIESM